MKSFFEPSLKAAEELLVEQLELAKAKGHSVQVREIVLHSFHLTFNFRRTLWYTCSVVGVY
jgi:hypothetical protein